MNRPQGLPGVGANKQSPPNGLVLGRLALPSDDVEDVLVTLGLRVVDAVAGVLLGFVDPLEIHVISLGVGGSRDAQLDRGSRATQNAAVLPL